MSETQQFKTTMWYRWLGQCSECGHDISCRIPGVNKETQLDVWVKCWECGHRNSLKETEVIGVARDARD